MKTIDEKIEDMRARVQPTWSRQYDFVETVQAAAIVVFGTEKAAFFSRCRVQRVVYARIASLAICQTGKQWLIDGKAVVEKLVEQSVNNSETP